MNTIEEINLELLNDNRSTAIDIVGDKLDPLLYLEKFDEANIFLRELFNNDMPLCIFMFILILTRPYRNLKELKPTIDELIIKTKQMAFDIGGEDKVKEIYRFL